MPTPRQNPTRRTTRAGQLLDRVIQQRRSAKAEAPADPGEVDHEQRIRALEQRVDELESLLQSLQDSVHREAARQGREIEALEAKTQAPAVARALDKYSREHGL
jgi:TolA-binding protein